MGPSDGRSRIRRSAPGRSQRPNRRSTQAAIFPNQPAHPPCRANAARPPARRKGPVDAETAQHAGGLDGHGPGHRAGSVRGGPGWARCSPEGRDGLFIGPRRRQRPGNRAQVPGACGLRPGIQFRLSALGRRCRPCRRQSRPVGEVRTRRLQAERTWRCRAMLGRRRRGHRPHRRRHARRTQAPEDRSVPGSKLPSRRTMAGSSSATPGMPAARRCMPRLTS